MMPDELDAIEIGDSLADPPPWTYDVEHLDSREMVDLCSSADPPMRPVHTDKRIVARFPLRQGKRRETDIQNLYFVCNARLNVRQLCASLRNAWARIEELESEGERLRNSPVAVKQATDLCIAIEAANLSQGSTECVDGLFCWSGQRAKDVLKAYETLRMVLCSSCSSDNARTPSTPQ